jgi:FkbM family methyltransferase
VLIAFAALVRRHRLAVDRVIHAGGHLGEEAPAYQQVGARDVLWIEGNPDMIPRLTANVAPYDHRVVQAMLGSEPGRTVSFHVSNNDSMSSSLLDLGTHSIAEPGIVYVGDQSHRLQTLDAVADASGFIGADFLNLDLQGYELECLKGAERVLEHVRTVYVEVNVDELYRGCVLLPELDAWLNARGFEAAEVLLSGSARRDVPKGSPPFLGWGDACYLRVAEPRPLAEIHPEDAADWFRG